MSSANPVPAAKPKLPKAERIKKEREDLLSNLAAGKLNSIRARTAFVLNHFPDARNSGRVLMRLYWMTFQRSQLGPDGQITEENLPYLENPMSIGRARAKIQNEYGLFVADEEVQEFRRERRREFQEAMVLDKPGEPIVGVFADESGKNEEYLLVGSVWTLDPRLYSKLVVHLVQWRDQKHLNGEFHFNQLSKKSVVHAKAFFEEALSMSEAISFKAVAVRQKGISRSPADLTMGLYYQLVVTGLTHEFSTGRLTRPRTVQAWKDKEKGVDALQLERVRQELRVNLPKYFDGEVNLDLLEPVDSKGNHLIQLADLFTGSINRVLNKPGDEEPNHKDEFAAFVLNLLGLDVGSDGKITGANQDVAYIHIIPS